MYLIIFIFCYLIFIWLQRDLLGRVSHFAYYRHVSAFFRCLSELVTFQVFRIEPFMLSTRQTFLIPFSIQAGISYQLNPLDDITCLYHRTKVHDFCATRHRDFRPPIKLIRVTNDVIHQTMCPVGQFRGDVEMWSLKFKVTCLPLQLNYYLKCNYIISFLIN